jgi:hypothetical protein
MSSLKLIVFSFIAMPALAAPPYSADTGKITTLFATATGAMAIQLDGGYPHATADGQCPGAGNFSGFSTADPILKSALLAAKSAGTTVTIITVGCVAGGGWFGLSQVYVN